ncbi:MAG TPA: MBL fold metallo-hydrolase [Kofleriaceae bacterium]|jgi:glyoxylase-like metal-dependent hydrolase (beta-lactamase superfamily II)|nr:MBL fold metallo-hydrolase [Kofleriaceae bacterium]
MLAAAALVISSAANAGAPMAKGPQAGWFRMKVGDFEVTALSDGTADLPMDQLLSNTAPDKVKKALTDHFLKAPTETSINAFVVNTGTKLVMIDAGAGVFFGPTVGKTVASLKAAGYKPEQIDEIYITHMHADHVGGLVASNKAVFPNATIRAGKAEGEFWLTQANMDKAPDQMKDFFKGAMAAMKPYAKKYKPIEGDDVELVPGIHALATPGHTPGHEIYSIESKGEKMVFCGDLMHVAAVQFADPSVTIQFDSDPKSAAPQRQKLYADAAAKGYYVAFAHVSFPGIGHLRKEGTGYEWNPVNYTNK